jgi:hypothetical protein
LARGEETGKQSQRMGNRGEFFLFLYIGILETFWDSQQLLAIWNRAKGKEKDVMLWGDEVEYLVVCIDEENRKVRLSLRQADILAALATRENAPDEACGLLK